MNPFLRWLARSEGKLYATEADWNNFRSPGGTQNSMDGGTIASLAGVLPAVTGRQTIVSGALALTGITLPWPTFSGDIVLLPTGAFTWTTATNIAVAGTAVVGRALVMTYHPPTAKWYPSYV